MKILKYISILFIVAAFTSCGIDDSKKYVLSVEETLDIVNSKADFISAEKLADIILSEDTVNYQLIDIRTPHEFIIDHAPHAINVPAKDILDEEFEDVMNQGARINIIYCKGSHQALNAYLMLKQLNYKNNRVSLGGFSFIKENILKNYGVKSGIYNDEKARYDYAKVVAETSGAGSAPVSSGTPKPKKKVVKKAKKEVEGGCG